MITIDKLKAFGADTETGLARCLGKEDFYLKMVKMGLENQNFSLLEQALAEKNLEKAFELAHSLKGVIGNLALTPLYEIVCQLTELLREKTKTDYLPMLKKLLDLREELQNM